MNKSGKIKLCLLGTAILALSLGAAGCGEEEHTHEFSTQWAFDAEAHWHPSSCEHDAKTNKSAHEFVSVIVPPSITSGGYTVNTCACGYSYRSDEVGALPMPSGDYRYDDEGHWRPVLSENGEYEVKEHTYKDETVAATCTSYGYTKHTCTECGYWKADGVTQPVAHTYREDVWEHDENGHWHPSQCCDIAKSEMKAHDYSERVVAPTCDEEGYTEFTCKDCGFSYAGRLTEASHPYADKFTSDEYEHWRAVTCDHTVEHIDVAEHVLVGSSNVCEICGKAVTPRLAYQKSTDGNYYIVTGAGCVTDRAIVVPDSYRDLPVREIASRAFADANITSVTFGTNLMKIGADAFANTQISAVTLPSGLEELGSRAFAGTKITQIELNASIQKIGYAVFRDCTSLKTVEIKGETGALPPYLFEGCTALTTVTAEKGLTQIGAQAFSGCTELVQIDLSECKKVEFSAFSGCAKLNVALSDVLEEAEEYAFSGCAFEAVTLPATLAKVGENLFNGCAALTSASVASATIGKAAFYGCENLSSLTLSEGVAVIGDSAFEGCGSLDDLALPQSLVRVGEKAFAGTGLIATENGVQYAAGVAIGANKDIAEVSLKAGTVGIADGAFRGQEKLASVNLGSAKFIGINAFRGCKKLAGVTLTGVKTIGANAFRESGLTSVNVPASVETVGDNAFYDCKSLESVEIHAKEIGRFAFSYTGVGRDLAHPVKERPTDAKLKNVTLGEEVASIGSNAFQYCPVAAVTLPANLKSIGKYAFAQTDLTTITIPASVAKIGEYAFYGCKLSTATFEDKQGWKAGKNSLNVNDPAGAAKLLTGDHQDIDWIKE